LYFRADSLTVHIGNQSDYASSDVPTEWALRRALVRIEIVTNQQVVSDFPEEERSEG
jgi:hypothetical protein